MLHVIGLLSKEQVEEVFLATKLLTIGQRVQEISREYREREAKK